jgi:hypothetical protein
MCDGCTNSIHPDCSDPPIIDVEEFEFSDDDYLCFECKARQNPQPPRTGLFGRLLDNLDRTNPMSFRLEGEIEGYFDGVGAKENGEYEDLFALRPPVQM